MYSFRHHHLLKILTSFETSRMPLDAYLARYFRETKAVGSKDRKVICETLYTMMRWKGLIDAQIEKPASWEKRLAAYPTFRENIAHFPLHVQVSFPKFLYSLFANAYPEQVQALCQALNTAAPTTIRVNLLKTQRQTLIDTFPQAVPTTHADTGLTFPKKINFFASPEFKKGFFEIQDEASQLVATHVRAKPGDHVLDYCAGAGGKTLAIAPGLEGAGQLYLYDIRPHALAEAKKRLKRAGVQNAQILDGDKLKKYHNKMDWVLVDAPCSGTGTLRRNPDMKWKITPDMIDQLIHTQREIFDKALQFLKPGGTIVYATCSILPCENQDQVAYFQKIYDLKAQAPAFQSLPALGEMDGFFSQNLIH
ncbi:MAG: RsmB/NOP family class I SAM-dependent RNA methyltransferase [Chlamydiia bacterium]|nr:RsmB/NOP family class I SAM-dependent RNA methyltransferase [Chlamydiia bacterium]MCP5509320.1 RsmB/NOP family class I SAM-dependent RNA methyltransferase [Chlamydiales bacterium]HPE85388.1 RsmB/NOP family class I SAM-dependent RNA methyltransferase [Chlamydiales bacterium]